MSRLERAVEHVITEWGALAILWMGSDSWWRKTLGLLLALFGVFLVGLLLLLWLLVGKKPK